MRELGTDEQRFKARTKSIALSAIQLVETLPKTPAGYVLGKQLLRSATSVGANYRAACRSRSIHEMIARLGVVEEEADESMYWLELIEEAGIKAERGHNDLYRELDEVVAMTVASIKSLRPKAAMAQNPKSKIQN